MELQISSSVGINLVGTVTQGQASGGGSLVKTLSFKGTIPGQSQLDVLSSANITMGSGDYIGLMAEYALETNSNISRRFGTIEVVFDNASTALTDNSTKDVGPGTQDIEFSATGNPLELYVVNNFTYSADIAMSFKLIAVP